MSRTCTDSGEGRPHKHIATKTLQSGLAHDTQEAVECSELQRSCSGAGLWGRSICTVTGASLTRASEGPHAHARSITQSSSTSPKNKNLLLALLQEEVISLAESQGHLTAKQKEQLLEDAQQVSSSGAARRASGSSSD